MTGSPMLRLAVVLAGMLLLIAPLWRLTHRAEVALPGAAPAAEGQAVSVRIVLTSTSVPFRFKVSHLGKTLWEGESAAPTQTRELPLPFPGEGIDLLVEAQWDAPTPAAMRIEVSPDGSETDPAVLWGTEDAGDVFTFR